MFETLDDAVGRTTRELGVIFIDCDDEPLERRYTETRRPHPLAGDRPVMDGIRLERRVVSALRDRAALVIDTSHLTAAALKRLRAGHFVQETVSLRLFITSFAYRRGLPRDTDLIFDVRFLDNPHYVPELRPLTGRDPEVAAHFERDPGFLAFLGAVAASAAARAVLREGRQDLSDNRRRLHRRPASLRLGRRTAGCRIARRRLARRVVASRSRNIQLSRADPGGCAGPCELRAADRPSRGTE
jgi:RNase adaptor protein for sRNA GlmZ degradation